MYVDATSTIQLPAGYNPQLLPAVSLTRDFADYQSTYFFEGGKFITHRTLTIKKEEVSTAALADYRTFTKAINDDAGAFTQLLRAGEQPPPPALSAEVQDLLRQGTAAMQSANVKQALADFQQATVEAPKSYLVWLELAWPQLTLGHQAEAEASLRKALDAGPPDLQSYYQSLRK